MHAVAESARNVVCAGGRPVAATNNLNFGNPEKPHIMAQLSDAVDGLALACDALGTPITGGNVSLYNETLGEGIYPTPVVGVVGIIDDISRTTRFHFDSAGRDVVLLHAGSPSTEIDFGSSEYAKELLGQLWGTPPALDIQKEAALQKLMLALIDQRLIESAHDCAEGGLAVVLAESAFVKNMGVRIDLSSAETFGTLGALFAETGSRIVISCDPNKTAHIKQVAVESGLRADLLGTTIDNRIEISVDGEPAVSASVSELKELWGSALEKALHTQTPEHLVPEVLQKS
jgi:phosphoribosylformylglycinamidine synthase